MIATMFVMQCSRLCFGRWILVSPAGLPPHAVVVFDNFQANHGRAISSPESYLRRLRAGLAAPARRAVKCNLLPSGHTTSRRHLEYRSDTEWPRGRTCIAIESNVTKQLKRARGQIAAGGVQNRVVIGKRHVFQPWRGDIFIKAPQPPSRHWKLNCQPSARRKSSLSD